MPGEVARHGTRSVIYIQRAYGKLIKMHDDLHLYIIVYPAESVISENPLQNLPCNRQNRILLVALQFWQVYYISIPNHS